MTDTRFKRIEKKKTQELISYDHSVWKDIKKELFSNKIALVSIVILLIIIIASILAPLSPYDPNKINVAEKLQGISAKHIFGTDEYGRDYFTRALYGGRISLTVGFCSMIMTVILGTAIGITSGYFGGKVDMFLMRFTDIFLALPSMLLMVVLNTILRPGLFTLIAVLSLFSWAQVARITRAETMSVKERDYVTAARNLGAGSFRIAVEYCTEYYGTGHRSGKPWNCQCDSDGVVLKFPWTWSTDSKSFLGKYAAECAGTYSGCTETCGISGSSDSVYSTEFQFTW